MGIELKSEKKSDIHIFADLFLADAFDWLLILTSAKVFRAIFSFHFWTGLVPCCSHWPCHVLYISCRCYWDIPRFYYVYTHTKWGQFSPIKINYLKFSLKLDLTTLFKEHLTVFTKKACYTCYTGIVYITSLFDHIQSRQSLRKNVLILASIPDTIRVNLYSIFRYPIACHNSDTSSHITSCKISTSLSWGIILWELLMPF